MKNFQEDIFANRIKIKHGYAFLGKFFSDAGTHIVLTPGNFFEEGGFKRIEGKEKWYTGPIPAEYVLAKDELIVAMTEQGEGLLGSTAIIPESDLYLHNQRIGLVEMLDPLRTDRGFMYYAFNTPRVRKLIRSTSSGAKVRHTSPSRIGEVKINFPCLETQKKIAAILSAYDDLIENNTRRIAILEEMARLIYSEWFVNFRFPGYEKVKFVDSGMGKIPEGWEVMSAEQALVIDPKVQIPKEGKKAFVPMASLSDVGFLINNIEEREGNSGSKFMRDDVLFARITPCLENGKTGFVKFLSENEVGFGSTEFIVLRSKKLCPEFVYLLARSDEFRNHAIKSMSGASGRQRVKSDCFKQFFLAHPPKILIEEFQNSVKSFFEESVILNNMNVNLRQTRDLLLPRLISGEIDVSGMEIEIKPD